MISSSFLLFFTTFYTLGREPPHSADLVCVPSTFVHSAMSTNVQHVLFFAHDIPAVSVTLKEELRNNACRGQLENLSPTGLPSNISYSWSDQQEGRFSHCMPAQTTTFVPGQQMVAHVQRSRRRGQHELIECGDRHLLLLTS